MRDTNRSLYIALLACLAMGLCGKSPQFVGERSWITGVFIVATLSLSVWGFVVGLRGARQQGTLRSWLAPALNALVFVAFTVYLILIFQALERIGVIS